MTGGFFIDFDNSFSSDTINQMIGKDKSTSINFYNPIVKKYGGSDTIIDIIQKIYNNTNFKELDFKNKICTEFNLSNLDDKMIEYDMELIPLDDSESGMIINWDFGYKLNGNVDDGSIDRTTLTEFDIDFTIHNPIFRIVVQGYNKSHIVNIYISSIHVAISTNDNSKLSVTYTFEAELSIINGLYSNISDVDFSNIKFKIDNNVAIKQTGDTNYKYDVTIDCNNWIFSYIKESATDPVDFILTTNSGSNFTANISINGIDTDFTTYSGKLSMVEFKYDNNQILKMDNKATPLLIESIIKNAKTYSTTNIAIAEKFINYIVVNYLISKSLTITYDTTNNKINITEFNGTNNNTITYNTTTNKFENGAYNEIKIYNIDSESIVTNNILNAYIQRLQSSIAYQFQYIGEKIKNTTFTNKDEKYYIYHLTNVGVTSTDNVQLTNFYVGYTYK